MKKIIVSLIILLGIINGVNAYALEDSFYEGNYIQGEYVVKRSGNTGKYKQMREFRRNSDNRLGYCIELWETMNNNKLLPGYDFNTSNYPISFDELNKVILLAYYGYGYSNHTDIKWYVITQVMIWRELSPESDIYFTDTLNGNRISKYESEMNEINNLVNNHYKIPSFHRATYNLNYNEWYTITDTNNNLANFDISSTGGLEVIKDGNNISVRSKNVGTSILELVNHDKLYSSPPIVYIDSSGQDLLVPGNYNNYSSVTLFNVKKGNLIVNKLDYDTNSSSNIGSSNLDGSIFQLFDNEKNVVDTKEVINGQAIFNNIGYGRYYLKEISPGVGYNLNKEEQEIVISTDNTNINFYNKVIKNRILIHKSLRNTITNTITDENKAIFEVYSNGIKINTIETNKYGKLELVLPYGEYILKQVSGTKNYKLVDDINIKVLEDGKEQIFELYNDSIIFNLKIENLDSDSLKPILEAGSIFKIKNIDTNIEIELETNESGITDTISLTSGNYLITQEKVVDGYIINKDKIELEINEDNYNNLDEIIISISNKKKTSKIEFSKIIEYYYNDILTDSKIDNSIEVLVYAKDDIYSKDGVKIYDKDSVVDNVSYNGNNIISNSLVLGNYYVKDLDENNIDVELDNTDTKKVSFLAKIYEYEEEIINDIVEISNNSETKIIEVENTLDNKNILDIYLILFLLGLILIRGIYD